ncbi:ornithine carbamoyltransferase [Catellatospora aurea]|uniref:Ornithine carbamoyltransferase n=1 Tax=Catellatospora aurea TaxID=1337874 RepID=A0ABW2H470_9ACTN
MTTTQPPVALVDVARNRRRSLLSVRQLTAAQLDALVERSVGIAAAPADVAPVLEGLVVATLFERTSTRTRTAFSVGALRLGAKLLTYDAAGLQLQTGETIEDTLRVLGLMLDGVVIRSTRTLAELDGLLDRGAPPIVNAMAREEHPTQAVCDLATMRAHLGALGGISVLYVGEGNNSASALAYALARVPGALLSLYVPPGYGLPEEQLALAVADATAHGAQVRQVERADELPEHVDVVYTTRWQTTGTSKPDPAWRETFRPYHVDEAFLGRWPAARFLHDLPAHRGEEVTGAVLDGPASLAWQQARMKLCSAMAVLETCWTAR